MSALFMCDAVRTRGFALVWMLAGLVLAASSGRAMASASIDVVISELMYHAPGVDADREYVEITNRGSQIADLTGWRIADGVRFSFPDGTTMTPGERLVVAVNPIVAESTYGIAGVLGPYAGRLDNDGDRIELLNEAGGLVCEVNYDDKAPWPVGGDGDGRSIEMIGLARNGNVGRFWKPSSRILGTPGTANSPGQPPVSVVINEFLANSSGEDWVELYNPGDTAVDLNGYYLSDHPSQPTKAQITSSWSSGTTVIPAKGYWTATQSDLGFALSGLGEQVYLIAPDGVTWVDGHDFGEQPIEDATEGRYPDGDTTWIKMRTTSQGSANTAPPPSDIVINEIMYHPLNDSIVDSGLEYVELHNKGATAVSLTGWSLNRGVDYSFPDGTAIAAGGYLVIAHDPAAVESGYGIGGVLGPYAGQLSNFSDDVEIEDELGNRIDIVEYRQEGLWPEQADGSGPSLELINLDMDNRLPGAWRVSSANGTPGSANTQSISDPPASIRRVRHGPVVPTSSDDVIVTARVGAGHLTSVTLYYKRDQDGSFSTTGMFDDGTHGDGQPNDGLYGGTIPSQVDGTIVEFYIQADATGGSRRYPDVPPFLPGHPERNCLYIVEDHTPDSNLNIYQFVLTDEYNNLLWDIWQDKTFLRDCTFIFGDKAYYNCGIRIRGNASPASWPKYSYKVHVTPGLHFRGSSSFDLNANRPDKSLLKNNIINRFLNRMGLYGALTDYSHTRWRGEYDGVHLYTEARNKDFLQKQFPDDYDGNLYKAGTCCCASLHYTDSDGDWEKQTNGEDPDWSDLHALQDALSGHCSGNSCPGGPVCTSEPGDNYAIDLPLLIDTIAWGKAFGVWATVCHIDSIWQAHGQNYRVYRRFSDNRFVIVQHDWDDSWWPWNGWYDTKGLFNSNFQHIDDWERYPPFKRAYYYGVWKAINLESGALREPMMRSELYYYHSLIEGPNDVPADPYVSGFLDSINGENPPAFNEGPDWLFSAMTIRNSLLRGIIQSAVDTPLEITTNGGQPLTVAGTSIVLQGTAPVSAARFEINGNEDGVVWLTETQWEIPVDLDHYFHRVSVRTLDEAGNEIDRTAIDLICEDCPGDRVYFAANPTEGTAGVPIQFTDQSDVAGITDWYWEFGDGQTSDQQHPSHIYLADDVYTVRLTVTSPAGQQTVERIDYITIETPPDTVDFSADPRRGPAPLAVSFADQSMVNGANQWLWEFGDGTTAVEPNPTHVFTQEGTFTVRLTVAGLGGSTSIEKPNYVTAADLARAAFIGGTLPLTVSDAAIVEHIESAGLLVSVYDDDPANRDSAAQIAATHDVVIGSSTLVSANVAGEFRNESIPFIYWEPALSTTDRESLADGAGTSGSKTQINVIDNAHPIMAGIPMGLVTVTDYSTNFAWNNGPIAPGVQVLATHPTESSRTMVMVAEPGALLLDGWPAVGKRVSLFLYDATWLYVNDTGKQIFDNTMAWVLGPKAATFSASNTHGPAPLTVAFTDESTGPVASWTWNFGDQAGGTLRHPSHTYSKPGTYDVSLTVQGGFSTPETLERIALIVVEGPAETPADLDHDGDVDDVDADIFHGCMTGANLPQNDPNCVPADIDTDGDVDQSDFGLLQRCLSGPSVPASPSCAD